MDVHKKIPITWEQLGESFEYIKLMDKQIFNHQKPALPNKGSSASKTSPRKFVVTRMKNTAKKYGYTIEEWNTIGVHNREWLIRIAHRDLQYSSGRAERFRAKKYGHDFLDWANLSNSEKRLAISNHYRPTLLHKGEQQ